MRTGKLGMYKAVALTQRHGANDSGVYQRERLDTIIRQGCTYMQANSLTSVRSFHENVAYLARRSICLRA